MDNKEKDASFKFIWQHRNKTYVWTGTRKKRNSLPEYEQMCCGTHQQPRSRTKKSAPSQHYNILQRQWIDCTHMVQSDVMKLSDDSKLSSDLKWLKETCVHNPSAKSSILLSGERQGVCLPQVHRIKSANCKIEKLNKSLYGLYARHPNFGTRTSARSFSNWAVTGQSKVTTLYFRNNQIGLSTSLCMWTPNCYFLL